MTKPFTVIPGVGKPIAEDLRNIGIRSVVDLWGSDPEKQYVDSNICEGKTQDRCLLELRTKTGVRTYTIQPISLQDFYYQRSLYN